MCHSSLQLIAVFVRRLSDARRTGRPMPPVQSRTTAVALDAEALAEANQRLRRLRIAAAVRKRRVLAALAVTEDVACKGPQGKKHRPQHNFSWRDHVRKFTAAEFKKRYRLDFKLHGEQQQQSCGCTVARR